MEVSIIKSTKNPLLYREEFTLLISFDGATPSRKEMREGITAKLGCNPDLMVIVKTKSTTGKRELKAYVRVYDSREKLEEIEPEHVLKRNGFVEEKKEEGGDE
jgi:small subunit ribosomal protein S24e